MDEGRVAGISLLRGLAYRLLPFIAFALALLGLEGGLRLAGYGYSGDYLRLRSIGGADYFTEDRDFFRAFFPPHLLPSIEPMAVPAAKGPRTVRIAVLGESAALGTPDPAFGFSRVLDRMLRHRHPDLDFEVVNLAATAVNSHVHADLAPRLAALRPDFFVVYAGNNEMIGPYGPGTVFAPFLADIRLVRAGIFLRRTRTGQLALSAWRNLGSAFKSKHKSPERWAGLGMFRERAIAPGAPCLNPAYAHYRRNLEDLVAAARGMGAQVLLSTLGSNLRDFAPLASVAALDGPPAAPTAEARWENGQTLLALHKNAEALAELTAARDLDALRFRADSRVNAIVREVAMTSGPGVRLADAEADFREASPQGIPGREFFHEHVHLTFAGNHRLAATVARGLDTLLLAAGRIAGVPGDEPLDAEVCRRELGLTGWSRLGMAEKMETLLSKPPFSDRRGGDLESQRAAGERAAWEAYQDATMAPEVLEEIQQARETHPADAVLARVQGEYLLALGRDSEASQAFTEALEALPQDARTRQLLAGSLVAQGRIEEALAQYHSGLDEDATLPELRNGLANLLVRHGDARGAISQYQLALQTQPNLPEVYYNLGRAYAQAEKHQEAVQAWQHALALDPGFQPAAKALGRP